MTTVLIVDDDRSYRKILEKKLRNYFAASCTDDSGQMEKIEIAIAEDGKEAIHYMQNNPVALLATDIHMPKINGLRLLSYLKSYHPDIPCIFMTVYAPSDIGEELINDNVMYIQKPFKVEKLGKMILSALDIDATCAHRSGIYLASFLQIIEMEGQSCIVKVLTSDGEIGYFSFNGGKLFDAVYGEKKGESAALQMIPLKSYKIEFLDLPKRKLKRRIHVDSVTPLIAQAMGKSGDESIS